MADYSQLMNLEKKKQEQKPISSVQSTNRPTDQSTSQLMNQDPHRSSSQPASSSYSKIVDRPKAFYITERLDKRLDEAVRYFQEKHGIKKVDRSTIVNVMLDSDANWTEETLDVVLDKVISQLTSRLMS